MKRYWIATGLAILGLSWQATTAIAQATMSNGYLNNQLREALCLQNWSKAIRVVDEMKRISPRDRQDLNYYRARLVIMRDRNARVASWPSASYCYGETDNPDGSPEATEQGESVPTFSPADSGSTTDAYK